MNRRTGTWSRVASTLILTIGIALFWSTIVVWAYYVVAQFWRIHGQVHESVQVAMDGTPVITSRSATDYLDTSFRTLDGQPLQNQREEWLTGASLNVPPKPPALWESPIGWSARIAGISDSQRPPVSWYIIRDDGPEGRVYLAGYDETTKRLLGYLGRGGFRRSLPPRDEWFDPGRNRFDWGSNAITTTGSIQYGGRAVSYGNVATAGQRLSPSGGVLIDGDRLLEIDLRARTLRTIHESPGLVAVAISLQPREAASRTAADRANPTDATAATTDVDAATDADDSSKAVTRVALRTDDEIIVLDPPSGTKRGYTLPAHVRDKSLQAYALANEQLLIHWWNLETWQQEFLWLSTDGSIARQEQVTLSTYRGESGGEASIVGALAMPIPIGFILAVFYAPIAQLQSGQATSYLEAVASALDVGWLGLVATPLVAAVLAWWTFRLQRKYHGRATGIWCAFVLLLGLPGFLAYWIEHRRPKLESCGECGTIVPRDREACAACKTEFAPPPRLGTEIFA
jgi:hypothetical protein